MKKGQILGNIWEINANAQFIRYCGIDQVVIYVQDPESEDYCLLAIDDNDNVFIYELVDGVPADWVGSEYYGYHKEDAVGAILFWEKMFSKG